MSGVAVIAHGNCVDGMSSAAVMKRAFGDGLSSESLFFLSYGENEKLDSRLDDFRDKDVYIVDYSFNDEDFRYMESLSKVAKSVTLIDHHASTFDFWKKRTSLRGTVSRMSQDESFLELKFGNVRVVLDKNECGASLCWKTLFPGEAVPKFVALVREGDIYRFSSLESRAFSLGMSRLEKDADVWSGLLANDGWVDSLIERSLPETKTFEEICVSIASSAKRSKIKLPSGVKVDCEFVVCPPLLRNRVGEMIYESSGSFAALLTDLDEDVVKISLRSSNSTANAPNVRLIAESFGFGGHDSASALRLSRKDFDAIFEIGEKKVARPAAKP